MKSGAGKLKSVYSQDMRSVHTSGKHLGSMSSVKASCLVSLQTLDTLLVPQQISQMSIRFLVPAGWYCSSRAHLHVYEALSSMSLPPRPPRNTPSYMSSKRQPPTVGWLRGQRASLRERRQQLPWFYKWELLSRFVLKPGTICAMLVV